MDDVKMRVSLFYIKRRRCDPKSNTKPIETELSTPLRIVYEMDKHLRSQTFFIVNQPNLRRFRAHIY